MPTGVYVRTEAHRAIHRTHGAAASGRKTVEYQTWRRMNIRCSNRNSKDYPDYGGRGIVVCDRWRSDFAAFLADMGLRPSDKHSIDRIENEGNYEPSNCRWATATEQIRSRRNAINATIDGERLSLIEWANRIGVSYATLYARTRKMSIAAAVALGPVGRRIAA